VDNYAADIPDMHRELYNMYYNDDVVVVELALNGTHKGDLEITEGVIPQTNKEMYAPTCDVFHLNDGKVREGTVLSLLRCGANPSKATRDIQKLECCHQEIAALPEPFGRAKT
jgi:SnoaL-like polyketide cyclase